MPSMMMKQMKLNVKHIPCNSILHRLLSCLVTGGMGWMINFMKDKDTETFSAVDHLSPWLIKAYEKAERHRKRFFFQRGRQLKDWTM